MAKKKLSKVPLVVVLLFLTGFLNHSTIADSDAAARQHFRMKKRLRFEHITTGYGLAQNTVYCIFLDKKGFLWFGTENGLNRYDGYELKTYEHDADDPDSLSSNIVNAIAEDPSGALWIGTKKGLDRFDRNMETFTHFKPNRENQKSSLSHEVVLSLLVDHEGVLWVGKKDGVLNRFNKKTGTFIPYEIKSGTSDSEDIKRRLEENLINVICEDRDNALWVGTSKTGLNRFDRGEKTFSQYPIESQNIYYCVQAICEDQSGNLWIGTTNHGLIQFDRERRCFTKQYEYDPDKAPNCLSNDNVCSIIEDSESKHLWIGTYGGGLNLFDPQRETFQLYKGDTRLPTSLSNDVVYSLWEGEAGLIWVGTEGGLDKLDKRKNEFNHWKAIPGENNSLNHRFVWSIFEDRAGILWIGTNRGLNKFDRETETFTHYVNKPNKKGSLSPGRVTAIGEDSTGTLWVGTSEGVLNRFDRKTETFIHYPLINNWINSIIEDYEGVLWVGTFNGLYQSDKMKKGFVPYKHDPQKPDSLSHDRLSCIFEDRGHNLWIGTVGGGLNHLDRKTGTSAPYRHKPTDSNSLSSDDVSYIYEDSKGILWVGTYGGGLNKLTDRETVTFKVYKKRDGLLDDTVFGILEDEEGNLWISGFKGLSKFNPKTGKVIRNYDTRDGLQSKEFNGGACFKSSKGEMFFGGLDGFNSFYPHRIKNNEHKPPIVITNFELLNTIPPKKLTPEKKEITLSHFENVFTIEFSALDFSAPSKNMYKHKLEGVDKDWIEGDARKRSITYTNVSPGEHIFQVKGANKDGTWNEEGETLKIKITPAFWQTLWFRIALIFLIVFAIFSIHQMRTKRLKDKLAEQEDQLAEQERIQKILLDRKFIFFFLFIAIEVCMKYWGI